MKEDKSIFLKVDSVEPVYEHDFSVSECPRLSGIKVWIGDHGYFYPCSQFILCDLNVACEAAREAGREEMRKALFDIFKDMGHQSRKNIFGSCYFEAVVRDHTPEEIITGLEKWKKEKDEIHVKDEVQHKLSGNTAVVIDIQKDDYGRDRLYAITKNKEFFTDVLTSDFTKTGVHVGDLDAYLEV